MAVKMRTDALGTAGADKWYVTDGAHAVGPVRLDLLARGIEAGRVPLDSFVRHEGWKVWRPLTDFTDYVSDPRPQASPLSSQPPRFTAIDDGLGAPFSPPSDGPDSFGPDSVLDRGTVAERAPSLVEFATSEGVASRSSFDSIPPPNGGVIAPVPSWTGDSDPDEFLDEIDADLQTDVSRDLLGDDHLELRPLPPSGTFEAYPTAAPGVPPSVRAPARSAGTDDIPSSAGGKEAWGSARAAESSDALADDDLRGAADLSDAMLLLLGAAVRRTRSEVALLHRVGDVGAKVVCAHGFASDATPLGKETTFVDPIFVAAASGMLVLAEPAPGSAGMAMARRLGIRVAGKPILGALMVPITAKDRLFGFIELGKTTGYTARELVKAEDLVAAFVRHAQDRGFQLT